MDILECIAIAEARTYKVVKSNEIIQRARFHLSLLEQKTLLYIISMIKPQDKEADPVLEYVFNIQDYCKICGIDYKNGRNYEYIKNCLKKLRDQSIWISKPDGTETTVSWLNKITVSKQSGKVIVRLDDDMIPYLFNLKDCFTQYELYNTLVMQSQYSIRFYELMKSYAFVKHKTVELEQLKKSISAEGYQRYPDFRRYILDVAVKEVNEYTDLEISYTPITKGRKVVQIEFCIRTKSTVERAIAQNKAIHELDD